MRPRSGTGRRSAPRGRPTAGPRPSPARPARPPVPVRVPTIPTAGPPAEPAHGAGHHEQDRADDEQPEQALDHEAQDREDQPDNQQGDDQPNHGAGVPAPMIHQTSYSNDRVSRSSKVVVSAKGSTT